MHLYGRWQDRVSVPLIQLRTESNALLTGYLPREGRTLSFLSQAISSESAYLL